MTKISFYGCLISALVFCGACGTNTQIATKKASAVEKTGTAAVPDKPVSSEPEIVAVTFGRGTARGNGITMTFLLNVDRYNDGSAGGIFVQSAITEAGTLDLEVNVTCASLDSAQGKGWIGGKVKRNDSSSPAYAGKPGADAWIRVYDLILEKRTALISLPMFGDTKIKTAEMFCQKKPWSEVNLLQLDQGALAIFP